MSDGNNIIIVRNDHNWKGPSITSNIFSIIVLSRAYVHAGVKHLEISVLP